MDNKSNVRFKIEKFIALAKLCGGEEVEEKRAYMDEAAALLYTISSVNEHKYGAQNDIIRNAVKEISEKADAMKYMTVSDFAKQDCRLTKIDVSLLGRILADMGYIDAKRISQNHVQVRARLLPYVIDGRSDIKED